MASIFDKIQRFFTRGQVEGAIKEVQTALKADPAEIRLWHKLADLLAKKGDLQAALETYNKVADTYIRDGFHLKALAVYKQILKLDGRQVSAYQRLAEICSHLERTPDAISYYQILANLYQQQGRIKESLDALKEVVELDPEVLSNRLKLAELYSREGMSDEAVEEFQRAADFLLEKERWQEFAQVAERLLYHNPEDLDTLLKLSAFYLDQKETRRALGKLQQAFKLDREEPQTLELLARAFFELEQVSKTVSVLRQLAQLYKAKGIHGKRRDVYEWLLELVPDDEEATSALAEPVPEEPDQEADGEELFDEGLAPDPSGDFGQPKLTDERVEELLAQAEGMLAEEDLEGTEASLAAVLGHDPEDLRAHVLLARLWGAQGKVSDALESTISIARQLADAETLELAYGVLAGLLTMDIDFGKADELFEQAKEFFFELQDALGIDDGDDAVIEVMEEEQVPQYEEVSAEGVTEGGLVPPELETSSKMLEVDSDVSDSGEVEFIIDDDDDGAVVEIDDGDDGAVVEIDDGADGAVVEIDDGDEEYVEVQSEDDEAQAEAESYLQQLMGGAGGRDEGEPSAVTGADGGDSREEDVQSSAESYLEELMGASASVQKEDSVDDASPTPPPMPEASPNPPPMPEASPTPPPMPEENPDVQDQADAYMKELMGAAAPPAPFAAESELDRREERGFSDVLDSKELSAIDSLEGGENRGEELDSQELAALDLLSDSVPVPPAEKYADQLKEGQALLDAHDFEGALHLFEQLLGKSPSFAEAKEGAERARSSLEESATERSLEHDIEGAFRSSSMSDRQKHQVVEQVAAFGKAMKEAVDQDENGGETAFNLGIAYREMGLYGQAAEGLRQAFELGYRPADSLKLRGLCLADQGKFDEALKVLRSGLGLRQLNDLEKLDLMFELGGVFERMGKVDEALAHFGAVRRKDPGFRDVNDRMKALRNPGS